MRRTLVRMSHNDCPQRLSEGCNARRAMPPLLPRKRQIRAPVSTPRGRTRINVYSEVVIRTVLSLPGCHGSASERLHRVSPRTQAHVYLREKSRTLQPLSNGVTHSLHSSCRRSIASELIYSRLERLWSTPQSHKSQLTCGSDQKGDRSLQPRTHVSCKCFACIEVQQGDQESSQCFTSISIRRGEGYRSLVSQHARRTPRTAPGLRGEDANSVPATTTNQLPCLAPAGELRDAALPH